MSITLRKRKIKSGLESLYLDIYMNGSRSYEYLDLFLLPKDKENNQQKLELAEAIRSKREIEIKNQQYGFLNKKNFSADFFKLLQNFIDAYPHVDKGKFNGVLLNLKAFTGKDKLPCNTITQSFIESFLRYLVEKLAPDTISGYLIALRRVLRYAVDEGCFLKSPAEGISYRNKDAGKLKKDYLLPGEFKILMKGKCDNDDLRRGFTVAYYTGLRGTDIRSLKWKEVKLREKILDLSQDKTEFRVVIDLNKKAIEALGAPGNKNDLVFPDFPVHRKELSKLMNRWVKSSGLEKHITFHCARHSLATNLIMNGVDLITVKDLMGLRSLKMLEKYAHADRKVKRKAIATLR